MSAVTKHQALEFVILLNGKGTYREWIICLLQGAFQNQEKLHIDILFHRMGFLAKKDSPEHLVALSHYMMCLALEYRYK